MKPGARLINVRRGAIVNTGALLRRLRAATWAVRRWMCLKPGTLAQDHSVVGSAQCDDVCAHGRRFSSAGNARWVEQLRRQLQWGWQHWSGSFSNQVKK